MTGIPKPIKAIAQPIQSASRPWAFLGHGTPGQPPPGIPVARHRGAPAAPGLSAEMPAGCAEYTGIARHRVGASTRDDRRDTSRDQPATWWDRKARWYSRGSVTIDGDTEGFRRERGGIGRHRDQDH